MFNRNIAHFARLVHATYGLPTAILLSIVKSPDRFTVRYRVAALRHLVCEAPLSVTHGLPYAQRRRLVRRHYGI